MCKAFPMYSLVELLASTYGEVWVSKLKNDLKPIYLKWFNWFEKKYIYNFKRKFQNMGKMAEKFP